MINHDSPLLRINSWILITINLYKPLSTLISGYKSLFTHHWPPSLSFFISLRKTSATIAPWPKPISIDSKVYLRTAVDSWPADESVAGALAKWCLYAQFTYYSSYMIKQWYIDIREYRLAMVSGKRAHIWHRCVYMVDFIKPLTMASQYIKAHMVNVFLIILRSPHCDWNGTGRSLTSGASDVLPMVISVEYHHQHHRHYCR